MASKVMLVREIHAEFNRRGWEAVLAHAHPEIEFHEPPEQPGAEVFHGLDAVRAGLGRWAETWVEQSSTLEDVVEVGDRVVLLTRERMRGRDGILVEHSGGSVFMFREGRIARWEAYWTRESALGAAGIAPDDAAGLSRARR